MSHDGNPSDEKEAALMEKEFKSYVNPRVLFYLDTPFLLNLKMDLILK